MATELQPFQERVSSHILAGRNVVLQAPTGSGKTRAALDPFLAALAEPGHHDLPNTCRYAVPLRTLANQFYSEYGSLSKKMKAASPHLDELAQKWLSRTLWEGRWRTSCGREGQLLRRYLPCSPHSLRHRWVSASCV